MALQHFGYSIMGWSKDLLDNSGRPSQLQVDSLVNAAHRDFPTANCVAVEVPANTNAQALAARGSNFGIDPALYAARFFTPIHAAGQRVVFRGSDCAFEGIYSFPKTTLANGNRYNFFGDPIVDSFSSVSSRDTGYGVTISAGALTGYLTSHQPSNTWTISGSELVGPTSDGWKRTILHPSNYHTNGVMTAKVKKIGHQQIVVRASTDPNSPGYGLQMRDDSGGRLRIEKPGLTNLAEIPFTWVNNAWYWLKLEATGTTVRGKAWLADDTTYPNSTDGSENEPGSWSVSVTDSSQVYGRFGFSGESNNGHFKHMKFVPAIATNTFLYRTCNWLRDNILIFRNNDQYAPFTEASSHQSLSNQGDYNQFFLDIKYCSERIAAANGITILGGTAGHIWTSTIQNTYNTLFNALGMAIYDHYGAAVGPNSTMTSGSASSGTTSSQTGTYNLLSSLSEAATDKCTFTPEKRSYNNKIRVYVVDKGTGNWTMEIHDSSNARVQMCDNTNFNIKTTTGIATVANADISSGNYLYFNIDWDNPAPDVAYHFHLYSSNGTGVAKVATGSTSLATAVYDQYKTIALAEALEIDIRKTYFRTGLPQYLQEWGDFWSIDPTRSSPVRNQAQHEAYLDSVYAAFQRLINDNILIGFLYWRLLAAVTGTAQFDVKEQIMYNVGGSWNYQLNYAGQRLKALFDANGSIVQKKGPFVTHFN